MGWRWEVGETRRLGNQPLKLREWPIASYLARKHHICSVRGCKGCVSRGRSGERGFFRCGLRGMRRSGNQPGEKDLARNTSKNLNDDTDLLLKK